jgi:hypothetical protein
MGDYLRPPRLGATVSCHFQDVAVFGCPGWQFKVTVQRPTGRLGVEIAPYFRHRKHSHSALGIIDFISIRVELLPATDSAKDLCPSEKFQLCTTPPNRICPLLLSNTSRCSNIFTCSYNKHFFKHWWRHGHRHQCMQVRSRYVACG